MMHEVNKENNTVCLYFSNDWNKLLESAEIYLGNNPLVLGDSVVMLFIQFSQRNQIYTGSGSLFDRRMA